MYYRLSILGLALVLLAFAGYIQGIGNPWSQTAPIRISTNDWAGFEPIHLARAQGSIPESAAKIIALTSAYDSIRALRSHTVDAALLTLDEALTVVATDAEYRIVLVTDVSHGADTILARPGITGLAGLKGRRVMVNGGAGGAYMLTRALDKAGLTTADITVLKVSEDQQERRWNAGEADAVVTFEPFRTKILTTGATEIFTSRDIPGEIVDVLIVHESVLTQRRAQLRSVLLGWHRQLERLKKNPDDTYRAIGMRLGLSADEARNQYAGIRMIHRKEGIAMFTSGRLRETAERLNVVMVDGGLIPHPASLEGLFDNSVTEESAP